MISDIFTAQNITLLYHTTWHHIPEDMIISPLCSPIDMQLKLNSLHSKKRVNQSRYRPGVAQRVPGSLSSQIFMTTVQGGGKVVGHTHRPHLTPGNSPGTHFC